MANFCHPRHYPQTKGFTLVELLVAIAVSGILGTAIFSTFFTHNKVYIEQEQVVAMQQNLRAGLDLMVREIRMAGFEGDGDASVGFITADANKIEFTWDENEDGDFDDYGEYLTYSLYGAGMSNLGRKPTKDANNQAVAENIVGLGFAYAFDADDDDNNELDVDASGNIYWAAPVGGNWYSLDVNADGLINADDDTDGNGILNDTVPLPNVNRDDIRAVQIWMLAQTGNEARGFTDTNKYVVGTQIIQPNNAFRHRLLSAVVECRNLVMKGKL